MRASPAGGTVGSTGTVDAVPETQRTSREVWIIAIGVVALLAVGMGVVLQTDLFSLRTPDPTADDVIPRHWGDDITSDLEPVDGWTSISGVMTWRGGENSAGWMEAWLGSGYEEQRDLASVTNHLDFDDPPGYLAHGADGRPMVDHTGHQPIGGANSTVMDSWFDDVVDQSAADG